MTATLLAAVVQEGRSNCLAPHGTLSGVVDEPTIIIHM